MKSLMKPLGAISVVLLSASPSWADDAYDDSERRAQPEDYETGESRDDESSGQLTAGGLAAPEAMPEAGDERTDIERELDEADQRDSGRGLEFVWLESELGVQFADLANLSNQELIAPNDSSTLGGLMLGAGAGVRALYFRLGARFHYAFGADYNLWSLAGVLGIRVPLGSFEPYAHLGLGAQRVSQFQTTEGTLGNFGGLGLNLGGGFDYYFSDSFSVGTRVDTEFLFLKRGAEAADFCAGCEYTQEGRGTGFAVSASLILALHF